VNPDNSRAALVTAHPGHELCVYGWLESTHPTVFILTDGSGRSGKSRINSTTRVLAQVGASAGAIYGRFTDATIYRAILESDFDLFVSLAEELAEIFAREQFAYVAADAMEGYNPIHDACRLVVNAAVELANGERNQMLANFDFALIGRQGSCITARDKDCLRIQLDDNALARKLTAMRAYPELASEVKAGLDGALPESLRALGEISKELKAFVSGLGPEAFRDECLRPIYRAMTSSRVQSTPFYEEYGEQLVALGSYDQVIRYRKHLLPVAEELQRRIERRERAATLCES
jgi:hypothetical protein